MTESVGFTTANGGTGTGAVAFPTGVTRAPAVVLLPEWWGINGHIKSLVDRLAVAGFVALGADLFQGRVTRDPVEAARWMRELQWPVALETIAGAVNHLSTHERTNGKVGVMGFCMGGAGALLSAAKVPGLSAAVAFYGLPPAGAVDWKTVRVPLQGHVGRRDQSVKASVAEGVRDEVNTHGGSFELHTYDADHAFVNDTRPEVYAPEAAREAWDRAVAFLHAHVG